MGPIHLHRQAAGPRILPLLLLLASFGKVEAGCTTAFTVTATPPPVGGLYSCGQTVTFCLTISGWGVVNNNWIHGVVADFGPGWDMSTLVPGTPPATVGGSGGTWGWYASVDGTSTSPDNTGAQGPGFFFDLDNDGNPGDNFGDFATTGPWTFCWTISVLDPPACTPGTDVSVTFSVFGDSQTGSWNTGGCGGATLTTVPAQVGGGCPSAGADNTLTLCGNAPPTALFPLLGAAATGGTWTGPGGIASTGTYNPAVQLPGAYVYTIAASPGCPADQAVITVNEQAPVDAGADGILSICSSSPPVDLSGSLAGAMGGGTWTGPGGTPFSGTYDPAAQASGVYTYTVASTAPCPNDQATVTVTEQPAPNAGTNGSLSICSNGAATALFPLLAGGTAGGTWTGPGGIPFNGTYDPAAQASGIYTYTVNGTAPCPNDQATVTVTEEPAPNAGADGILSICSSGVATALLPLITGAPAGGTWTAPGGAPFSGTYDPATQGSGVYTYTVAGIAPCPSDQATVTVTEQPMAVAGADADLSICSNGAATALLPLLIGAQGGGTWTDPGGAPFSGTYDPMAAAAGMYTYTVPGTAPCPNDQAIVTVQNVAAPDAGTDGALTLCAQGAPADLFSALANATAGGTWTAPGGAAHGPNYDPTVDVPGNYVYTVAGTPPCMADQAIVAITETTTPDAGADGTLTLCANGAPMALFPALTAANPGGTWTDPSGVPHSGLIDPTTEPAGIYTYTVAAAEPCLADQAQVIVIINAPPNAGADGALTVCAQGAPADLFAQLTGAAPGGTWTAPNGVAHGPDHDPAVDAPGTYTYTVNGTPPCPADQAVVVVTGTTTPQAGNDGAITLCATSAPADLFAQLVGADAGGTWTAPNGAAHGSFLDPSVDAAGVYTYTIAAVAPCAGDVAQVTVAINNPPNAGADGAITLCAQGAPTNLFAQLAGATAGGSWTDPNGAAHGAFFDPASDPTGTYTYTLTGTPPCPADQATVTVGLTATPNAGSDGAITLCATSAPADLFAQLVGADAGGTWTAPNGATHGASLDPSVDAAGVYTYTIAAVTPCAGDAAQVTVAINNPPNAGADGAITLCAQGAPTNLFAQLAGATAGGSWTDPTGTAHGAFFDPASDPTGIYTYTLSGAAPCPADQATVTVGLTATPNAGSDGAITLCATDAPADLFAQLVGADAGGTWTAPNGATHGASLDPSVDAAGVYTYTIAAVAPCAGDAAQVTVAINNPPNAGADGAITLCAQGAPTNLFAQLAGATAGGSWTDPTGAAHGAFFDPASDPTGIYTYTFSGTAPCPADQATVTVGLTATPNAGSDGVMTLCATDAPADLFEQLVNADGGGSWTDPTGAPHSSTIDPVTDPAGTYIYTIAAIAPCAGDAAHVMVAISVPPHAGTDAVLSACAQGGAIDLFAQLIDADEGGSWTGPDGLPHSIVFDPTVDGSGTYTYSLAGDPPCPSDAAAVIVNVVAEPDAGSDGARVFCTSDASASLFAALGGTPDMGGTWTDPNGTMHGPDLNPATDAAGAYTYTVAASPPCPSASSVVTITIQAMPDAGNDGMLSLCTSAGSTDLFHALSGTPQVGGSWTDPDGNAMSGVFDPVSGIPGGHVYTAAGIAPCPSSSAVVQVAVVGSPNAGGDATVTLCTNSDPFFLTHALAGTPDLTGTWTAPDGLSIPVLLDPATAPSGTYTYVVGGDAPCVNDTARLAVTVHLLPTNGLSAEVSACASDAPLDLFAGFAGAAQAGGVWTDPSGSLVGAPLDPATAPSGVYTYTVTGTAPCPNGINTVTVHVDAPFTAGNDGSLVLCASDAPFALFSALGGTPDANGTWTDPAGIPTDGLLDPATGAAGDHLYHVPSNGACPGDQAVVNVMINVPPNAGLDNAMTWCANIDPLDPLSWLNGTPQAGGTWSDPYGMPFTGPLDPASAAEGSYTYTVPGLAPCPAASAVLTVAIDPLPDPGDDTAIALCPEAPAFDLAPLLGTPLTIGGTWTDPLGLPTTGLFDPASMSSGNYTYTLEGTGACTGNTLTSLVDVTVHAAPSAAFSADTTNGCIPLTVIFSVQDPSVASVLWQFDDGGTSTGTTTTSHTFNAAGSYSIQAVVTDTNGCTAALLAEDLIFVQPPPIAWFSADPDPTNTNDPEVTFTPTQLAYPGYSWTIDGHTAGSGAPWVHAFPDAIGGEYVVCLTVTDAIGCTATYCDPVRVEDALAYHVPNAFTPDGDGINDVFAPIMVGADREHYSFFIFDRWGMIVFESHTVGEAWDGTMGDHGDALPEDVYVWRLLVGDRFSTCRKEEMGHVTLLR